MVIGDNLPHKLVFLFFRNDIAALKMVRHLKNHEKDRVEGSKGNPRLTLAAQFQKALLHLHRCRFGKRNYQNMGCLHPIFCNQIFCSLGNHGCLAAPRSRQYHAWTAVVRNGSLLCLVKFLHYFVNNSIPLLMRASDSSLPNTSISSVAPPGVICLPDTAVRIGHIT